MIGFEKIYGWFTNVLYALTVLLTFQFFAIPVSARPIDLGQDHYIGNSETYTYDEIESSVGAKDYRTGGLSRVLSIK